jgi:hypothetical protein
MFTNTKIDDSTNFGAWRPNSFGGGKPGGWEREEMYVNSYMQLDLGQDKTVLGVATQGRSSEASSSIMRHFYGNGDATYCR